MATLGNTLCENRFMALVHMLSNNNIISSSEGDSSLEQFQRLLRSPLNVNKFRSFERHERLEDFFFKNLDVPIDTALSQVLQVVFVMSNSQSEVESGFSHNKAVLEPNMSELTLISKRTIKIYMISNNLLLHQVQIST